MKSSACRICFVRHGETDWNTERRMQGHQDIPLNAVGVAQARATAMALKDEAFAAIYTSDLLRARHTAETIADVLKQHVQQVSELRERCYGVLETLTHEEAQDRHPDYFTRYKMRHPDCDLHHGESLARFSQRILVCVTQLVHRHAGESILVVTHGGVLDVLYRHITNSDASVERHFTIPNAGINWIVADASRWEVLSWADRSHLVDSLDEL